MQKVKSSMIQNQMINKPSGKSMFLDTVIDCIAQRNNSPNRKLDTNNQQMNINNLYNKADSIIAQFDNQISRCKKYNQAKINRKYQIIIIDLQNQNNKLSEKLRLQQDARSPTKKHISDLLDKLVTFRDQNQKYKQQIHEKDKKIKQLEILLDIHTKALQIIQNQQPKTLIQRLPAVVNTSSLSQSIKNFLKDKQLVKKLTNKSTSKLQKFLMQNKPKTWNWTIPVLLEELQKWAQGISTQKKQVDMWRIRSSIAHKFSNVIDNSISLTKPSKLQSLYTSQVNSPRQEKLNNPRKLSNYSYNGSKQKLNFSFV